MGRYVEEILERQLSYTNKMMLGYSFAQSMLQTTWIH